MFHPAAQNAKDVSAAVVPSSLQCSTNAALSFFNQLQLLMQCSITEHNQCHASWQALPARYAHINFRTTCGRPKLVLVMLPQTSTTRRRTVLHKPPHSVQNMVTPGRLPTANTAGVRRITQHNITRRQARVPHPLALQHSHWAWQLVLLWLASATLRCTKHSKRCIPSRQLPNACS
jgi:hypothetical protein